MCGIFVALVKDNNYNKVFKLLQNRGPDFFQTLQSDDLLFAASILQTQGDELTIQPCINSKGILLFNGDLFMEMDCDPSVSDTDWLFGKLSIALTDLDIYNVFQNLRGPFSCIYYDKTRKVLYFCRDSLGRNSLLISKTFDNVIVISSVLDSEFISAMEIPALGVFSIDLNTQSLYLASWLDIKNETFYENMLQTLEKTLEQNITVVKYKLQKQNTTKINKFSYNYEDLSSSLHENDETIITKALSLCHQTSSELLSLLEKSVKERVKATEKACKMCYNAKNAITNNLKCHHSKVSILFSGGLDCSLIAALVHKHIDENTPIELLNIAFEKCNLNKNESPDWNVPDRITGLQTTEELKTLYPNRQWIFVEINIPREELNFALKGHLKDLVFPLSRVLDESLGASFWFASKGVGKYNGDFYKSTARIMIIGSGADEIFGGYSRHRNAAQRGYQELEKELELDLKRLPYRNLARDDRVICDNNVSPRAPYLQEDVLQFTQNLDVNQKCYHILRSGIGDKLLLRCAAYSLGLRQCAFYKKRAVQFGSRIANKKQNASDTSEYLKF